MKTKGSKQISVLLPLFNGQKYLEDALDSLLSQSFEDFEIIVCDDNSSDESFQTATEFASRDNRVKLVKNKTRLGLFANYNRCMDLASGKFIKPFAQDDLLHPDNLSECFKVLEENPTVSLVSVSRRRLSSEGELINDRHLPGSSNIVDEGLPVTGSEVIHRCLFPLINYIGEPSCVMFRRSAAGVGFDENFYHLGDLEYWLRILLEGDYFYLPEHLTYFRNHLGSASTTNSQHLLSALDIVRLSKKFGWIIEGCDYTEEEFLCKTLDDFSSYLRVLITSEHISLGELRTRDDIFNRREDILSAKSDQERERLVSRMSEDLSNFRELAFIAMMQLGQKGAWVNSDIEEVASNKLVIRDLEKKIRDTLNSPSWKATQILRELNRPFIKEPEIRFDQEKWQSSTNKDTVEWQRQYIEYLKELIAGILASRSWKLAGPIRAVTSSKGGSTGGIEN